MKRYGYKQIAENGDILTVEFYDWYEIYAGYKVILNGEIIGYTTFKDMCKLNYDMDKFAHKFYNFTIKENS